MTREDIECIIKWFSHIEQLATDGKTANGFQMPTDKILATIKVVAKDSREYIEKFCNDSVPNDLEEAADEYEKRVIEETKCHHNALTYAEGYEDALLLIPGAFIDGAKWQREQDEKDLSEKIAAAYQLGLADKEKHMMKEAVECIVEDWNQEPHPEITIPLNPEKFSNGDRVRIIIVQENSHE